MLDLVRSNEASPSIHNPVNERYTGSIAKTVACIKNRARNATTQNSSRRCSYSRAPYGSVCRLPEDNLLLMDNEDGFDVVEE